MTKRLQVLLDEREHEEIQRVARSCGVTVAAWVRQALREARRKEASVDGRNKLQAIRNAARHAYPTADIDQMLGEIENGYAGRGNP